MKRTSAIAAVTAAALALSLAACGSADSAAASSAPAESTAASTEAASSEAPASEAAPAGDFDADQDITVISREDGIRHPRRLHRADRRGGKERRRREGGYDH